MRSVTASMPCTAGGVFGHRQAPRLQRAVGVVQRLGLEALGVAEAVADHPQLAARGDGRILLPQRAGRAVARIGERRLALGDQTGVEVLEVGDPEEHLATHLENLGQRELLGAGELLGHVVDGAGVERDVLAGAAVAAGRRAHQPAVAVHQRQRHTVDLQLAQVVRVVADLALDARGPRRQLLRREDVVQAQHPLEVLGRGEVGGEARAADQLRRRVGGAQFGMLVFERLQLAQQLVELGVGDDRRVPDVVAELVLAHLVGEFLPAAAQIGVRRFLGLFGQRRFRLSSGSPSQAIRAGRHANGSGYA